MTILGAFGIISSIYFILKIRKIDRYYDIEPHLSEDNFADTENERNKKRSISSASTLGRG